MSKSHIRYEDELVEREVLSGLFNVEGAMGRALDYALCEDDFFSPDHKWLAVGSDYGGIKVWDFESGLELIGPWQQWHFAKWGTIALAGLALQTMAGAVRTAAARPYTDGSDDGHERCDGHRRRLR